MAIDANRVFLLAQTANRFGFMGRLCTLGRQDVRPDNVEIAKAIEASGLECRVGGNLYERLHFDNVESLDLSDFEGATHIFDLNTQGVPTVLRERFDVVYNGGTIEHV